MIIQIGYAFKWISYFIHHMISLKHHLVFVLVMGLTLVFAQQKDKNNLHALPKDANHRLMYIDSLMQTSVSKNLIHGASIMILREGKVVYDKAFGFKDFDKTKSLNKTDIFRIASQTKAITSTAIMILFEEGKLLLDDPVSRYLPIYANPKVRVEFNPVDSSYKTISANRLITIRDLLTHSSGIGYAEIGSPESKAIYAKAGIPIGFNHKPISMIESIDKLGLLPLEHHPGERFTYGLNTDILGRVVEVVSGMSLDVFFEKHIFTPLGMRDTYFALPRDKQNRLVEMFSQDSLGKVIPWVEEKMSNVNVSANYPINNNGYFSGGAGLVSTTADYANFLQMILNNGSLNNKRLLSKNSVRLMTSNQLGDYYFGFAFSITSEKESLKFGQSVGTLNVGGYWGTIGFVDPKDKVVALLFLQQSPFTHGDIFDKFKTIVATLY